MNCLFRSRLTHYGPRHELKKKNNDILLKVLPEGFSSNRYGKGRRLWRCRNWKIYASDAFEGLARNC